MADPNTNILHTGMSSNSNLQPVTELFRIQNPNGVCKTPQTITLFLLALWIPPAICQFVLGSILVRSRLSYLRSKKSRSFKVEWSMGNEGIISMWGSFFIRAVIEGIPAAVILVANNHSMSFTRAYFLWAIRPQPGKRNSPNLC